MEYIEVSGKTVDDAVTEALIRLQTTSDKIEYEVIEKGSSGFLGIGNKQALIRVKKKDTVADSAEKFLKDVMSCMDVEAQVSIQESEDDRSIDIELVGDSMGILIGKRGQTLDALQYLTSLVVNKNTDEYVRVRLDTENYRRRRRETLENLAKNIAFKVKRTRRPVVLEPMNPFERRVIHYALQSDEYVSTHSEGDDPYRHVVVTLKK